MSKYIFRGYDNPKVEGHRVTYGEGTFTVGKAYEVVEIDREDEEAQLIDDKKYPMWEELMFFDFVEECDLEFEKWFEKAVQKVQRGQQEQELESSEDVIEVIEKEDK